MLRRVDSCIAVATAMTQARGGAPRLRAVDTMRFAFWRCSSLRSATVVPAGAALSPATAALLRLEPLAGRGRPDVVCFSGGVSEYIYGRETVAYGDLGPALARAVLERVRAWGPRIEAPDQGIRATVVGDHPSPGVAPGIVLRQSPQAGFQIGPGEPISLEVSR